MAAAFAAGLALRYGWIEPEALGFQCTELAAPWWCRPRQLFIDALWNGWLSAASVIAGLWAIFSSRRAAALTAIALGSLGLMLFSHDGSAVGLLCGLLSYARRHGQGGRDDGEGTPQDRMRVV